MDTEWNRVLALCDAIRAGGGSNAAEDLETVYDVLLSCADYVRCVVASETLRVQRGGMDSAELGARFEELDHRRTHCHDGMITNIRMLNNLCILYQVPPLYLGDEDRAHYGDFAIALVHDIFDARQRGVTFL